jgi:hypothetical protein
VSKRALWITGFIASLGIPYFSLDGNVPQSLQQARTQWFGTNHAQPTAPPYDLSHIGQADTNSASAWHLPQIFGNTQENSVHAVSQHPATPVVLLPEALRHELNPQWVMSRWPNAASVSSEAGQIALRVPLITGYEPTAIVGSLTYIFDSKQQLSRLSFVGQTHDERMLLTYLLPAFGLQLHATVQGQLFLNQHEGHPLSMLQIEPANSEATGNGKRIILELNRPLPSARMSPEMRQYVSQIGNL